LPFIYALSALILQIPSFVTDFFRNFAVLTAKLLALGRKNKRVCFVLLSFFRNFAKIIVFMEQFRGIPYGISNFKQLRRENLYYVDKSQYISKLEQTGQ